MKKRNLFCLSLTFLAFALLTSAFCQQIDKNTLWSESSPMTHTLSNYYKTDPAIVATLGKFLDAADDASVCLYFASFSGLDPRDVMGMRRQGLKHTDIMKSLSIDPSKLFLPAGIYEHHFKVPARFQHAYDQYKQWQQDPSRPMDLSDQEVQDLVQLQLVVNHFGKTAIETMRERNAGTSWTSIIIRCFNGG